MNVHAAVALANELEEPATIVTVLCDLGVKYLSKIYSPTWLAANGFDGEATPATPSTAG